MDAQQSPANTTLHSYGIPQRQQSSAGLSGSITPNNGPRSASTELTSPQQAETVSTSTRKRKPRTEKKPACTGCRQQKLRCDAFANPGEPCSRCKRLHLNCHIVASFQRTSKSKKMAEMEEDVQKLRERVKSVEAPKISNPTTSPATPSSSSFATPVQVSAPPYMPYPMHTIPPSVPMQNNLASRQMDNMQMLADTSFARNLNTRPTLARTIDKLTVSGHKIDDCFALFFKHYHPMLPILDQSISPNESYNQSAFRFWVIVGIGSRRYPSDPTLLALLAPHVIDLALRCQQSRANPIQALQGLLLLCTWPFLANTFLKDFTYSFTGSLLHMAIQAGLHMPGVERDFAVMMMTKNQQSPVEEIKLRANLWAHITLTCQAASFTGGYPPLTNFDMMQYERYRTYLRASVSDSLALRYRCQNIVSNANMWAFESGLGMEKVVEDRGMENMLNSFETQMRERELDFPGLAGDGMSNLYVTVSRLHLQCLNFFCASDLSNSTGLTRVYNTAISVVNQIARLDIQLYVPDYLFVTLLLSAMAILRITRSSLGTTLSGGSEAFFQAIGLLKQMSIENNDVFGRSTMVLRDLWTSEKCFRSAKGGTWIWPLRVRSRLSVSVVYDAVWWWKDEYGVSSGWIQQNEEAARKVAGVNTSASVTGADTTDSRGGYTVNPSVNCGGVGVNGGAGAGMELDQQAMPFFMEPYFNFADLSWATSMYGYDDQGTNWCPPVNGNGVA